MNGHTRNLVFKAAGTVGVEGTERAMVLLAFEATQNTASQGWPAVLRVADAQGRKASTRGRVFGLGESRSVTFSSVIGRDGDDGLVFADLLRVDWDHAQNRLIGTFLPPVAASQVSALYRRLRADAPEHAQAIRTEIESITDTYGQAVDMPVKHVAQRLRITPASQLPQPRMG